MTIEHNKVIATDFLRAICSGDVQDMSRRMTDDATYWVSPSTVFSGLHTKEEFLAIVPQLFGIAAGPFEIRINDVTAEADRVSVTAKGRLPIKSGQIYSADYHFLFWVDGDKVARAKEYADSAHAGTIFGFPEDIRVSATVG